MRAIQGPAQGIALLQRQSRSLSGLVPTMWFKHQPRESYQDMLTAHRLRKVLNYNPATGKFRWRVTISSRALAGSVAGTRGRRGHNQIRIDGKLYQSSRLAWLYMTGKWPKFEINYISRNTSNTRWADLREMTSSKTRTNARRRGKLGKRGVSRAG